MQFRLRINGTWIPHTANTIIWKSCKTADIWTFKSPVSFISPLRRTGKSGSATKRVFSAFPIIFCANRQRIRRFLPQHRLTIRYIARPAVFLFLTPPLLPHRLPLPDFPVSRCLRRPLSVLRRNPHGRTVPHQARGFPH